jgi:hypothetical protein
MLVKTDKQKEQQPDSIKRYIWLKMIQTTLQNGHTREIEIVVQSVSINIVPDEVLQKCMCM